MSQVPPVVPGAVLRPHRGVTVLVLGILGIVLCVICGIIAWVMGANDLREMDAGRMDPSGRGLTQAGKICGMIGTLLQVAIIGIYLLILLGVLGTAAAGLAGSASGGR
jgi:hypothetical protein